MYLRVSIPSYRHTDEEEKKDQFGLGSDFSDPLKTVGGHGKGHFVYQVDVVSNNFGDHETIGNKPGEAGRVSLGQGRLFRIEKRYSEFLALHNEVGFNDNRLIANRFW